MISLTALCSLLFIAGVVSPNACVHAEPTIVLDEATFAGTSNGLTSRFAGIPFAKPPVGALRLNRPVLVDPYSGHHDATDFGFSCPQQNSVIPSTFPPGLDLEVTGRIMDTIFNTSSPQSEDCLSLNVWTPSNASPDSKLPVLVWIHGGGFEVGSSSRYNGGIIAERSIELGEPLVFVSINYRLSALGWISGREAQDAGVGNLGHRDQRVALQWIQKYIHAFGGDSSKVTIWGESGGAVSVLAQLIANGGDQEGLFRGAYMESASIPVLGSMEGAQVYYDRLVVDAGCGGHPDTLQCLRDVPYDNFKAAMDASPSFLGYQSIALAWGPRTDGDFFPEDAYELVKKGAIANVPAIISGCEDEGTLFALANLNISTADQLGEYFSSFYFPDASKSDIDQLFETYPEDPSAGSPFNTGNRNVVTSQNKRAAAILGDIWFEMPKWSFLQAVGDGSRDVWTSVTRRRKDLFILGSAHVTDLFDMFGPSDMTDHLIHFVNHLDPNGLSEQSIDSPADSQVALRSQAHVTWPKYNTQSKLKLVYQEGPAPLGIMQDTEREAQLGALANFWEKHKLP